MQVDTTSFRGLFGKSSKVEPRLRTALRRKIRTAANGLVTEVQQAARTGGPSRAGLRDSIAAGIKAQIMTGTAREGVRITSSGLLAAGWQAEKGWRHPVFGRRERVQQMGRPGHFYQTLAHGAPRVKAAVEAAMREAAAALEGAS